jgi:hypothetical protein
VEVQVLSFAPEGPVGENRRAFACLGDGEAGAAENSVLDGHGADQEAPPKCHRYPSDEVAEALVELARGWSESHDRQGLRRALLDLLLRLESDGDKR